MTDHAPRIAAAGSAVSSSPPSDYVAPDADRLAIRAVHRAIGELRRGVPVLLAGPDPLLLLAAETADEEGIAEFAALASGPACLLLASTRASAVLRRPLAAVEGVTALRLRDGIQSAALRSLADPTLAQLGPERVTAQPEPPPAAAAAVALAKLARLLPAVLAAPCPMTFGPTGPLAVTLMAVLAYPDAAAASLTKVAEASVPLEATTATRVAAFRPADGGVEHLAVLIGRPEDVAPGADAPLLRIHSECFTGDLLGSLRCDCGPQLRRAIARMDAEGAGVLLYLAQEGRGIGIASKLRAYVLQDEGADTADANRALGWQADERNYLVAARMLGELGIGRVRLLTNNPDKLAALAACGIEVQRREAHAIPANGVNDFYLSTKATRFGHLLW